MEQAYDGVSFIATICINHCICQASVTSLLSTISVMHIVVVAC